MIQETISAIRTPVKAGVARFASVLNRVTKGKIHPDAVTLFGAVMHIPIAVLIASGEMPWLAAILLIVFGLFDSLDGALARVQDRSSAAGMLLDASTDRMKEAILYIGVAYLFAGTETPLIVAVAVLACGASMSVSYVKAKGEAAVASSQAKIPHATLNHMFSDGLLTFEVRMALLVIGLLSGYLVFFVAFIAVFASYTALWRLVHISKALR